MKTTSVLFGTLAFLFVVFITMNGNLSKYLALFTPKKAQEKETGNSKSGLDILDMFKNMSNPSSTTGTSSVDPFSASDVVSV